jgi:asparagine synthase (glutamine-hydrolysing)
VTLIAGACGASAIDRIAPLLGGACTRASLAPAAFGVSGGVSEGATVSLWATGAMLVAADARIDDRSALLRRLGLSGSPKLPDAAILAHAWERWGGDTPQELYGDYAFAVFDRRSEHLWLVRDALGFRPLAFTSRGSAVAFCSLPSRLATGLRSTLVAARSTPSRSTPLSWFDGVEQVQPGESVRIRAGAASRTFWWQPSTSPSFAGTREDAQHEMRAALDAAVADRIAGATRIASHLSAGLDSMAVTVTAADLLPPGARIDAITARPIPGVACLHPAGRLIDESGHAAMLVARYPDMRHIVVDAGGRSIAADALAAAARFDQPLPNLANFGWFAASCDAARQAGADRLLIAQSGNFGLSAAAGDYWWPLLRKDGVARFVAEWRRSSRWRAPFAEARRRLHPRREARADMWLGLLRSIDPGLFLKGFARQGLDVLDPTADRRVVERALTLPQHLLIRNGDPRWVTREMLRGRVPDMVLDDPCRGFQSADWLGRLRAEAEPLAAMLDRAPDSAAFAASRGLLRAIRSGFDETLDLRAKSELARDLAIAGFTLSRSPLPLPAPAQGGVTVGPGCDDWSGRSLARCTA